MTIRLATQPYKGARDFYPADMRLRQYWSTQSQKVVEAFGYEPYDGPVLERSEIFEAKTSEEIVSEQTYRFTDRGGRDVVIRPEMTPTFARMVAAKSGELIYPLRWYAFPNLLRYERPQKGRLREHWQLNCDLVAPKIIPEYELEMFRLIIALMQTFGAKPTDYVIRYNHRGLSDALFKNAYRLNKGQRKEVFYLLDRADKTEPDVLKKMAKDISFSVFEKIHDHLKSSQNPGEIFQDVQSETSFEDFNTLSQIVSEQPCIKFDPSIVRGFEYYTGLVFEVVDTHPDNRRAILGGGRYDNLISNFSKQSLQGIGFGWGDVTFRDFLNIHGLVPDEITKPTKTVSLLASRDVLPFVLQVQNQLQEAGISCRLLLSESDKMFKSGLKNALKHLAKYMIIIGPDEAGSQKLVLKTIQTREDKILSVTDCIKVLQTG
jgi:histidyl-tRNA synthetase